MNFIYSCPLVLHYLIQIQGAVGAMDGTLITASVPAANQTAFRSRKAQISQNVLAICDFDMMFTFVYAGWEGSTNDAFVLRNAINCSDDFPFPPNGKYYLVDAGFANYPCFLAPYRGCRYHLQEWTSGRRNMRGPQELFNYTHSRLRNCIERCFGVLKRRFALLRDGMPPYDFGRQVEIVIACCAVHNFIRRSSRNDQIFNQPADNIETDEHAFSQNRQPNRVGIEEQGGLRDEIALALWANYDNQ